MKVMPFIGNRSFHDNVKQEKNDHGDQLYCDSLPSQTFEPHLRFELLIKFDP